MSVVYWKSPFKRRHNPLGINKMAGIDNGVLECMICFENFNQRNRLPKMLPCQHTLCLACVDRLRNLRPMVPNNTRENASPTRNRVTCPECREDYKLPKQGFPNNITILRLMTSSGNASLLEDTCRLPSSSFQETVSAVIKEKTLGTISKIEELLQVTHLSSKMDVSCELTRSQINSAFHMALDIVKNRHHECLESLDSFVNAQASRSTSVGRIEEFCSVSKRNIHLTDINEARRVMETSKKCLEKLHSLSAEDLLMQPTFQLPNIEVIVNNLGRLNALPTNSVNTFQEIEQMLASATNMEIGSLTCSLIPTHVRCDFNIKIMTPKTEFKVMRPSGVTVTKDGTIVVISFDKHYGYLFSQSDQSARCFGGYGIEKGKLWNPQGVCVNERDEIIIVDGSKYISIFNSDGQIVDCFGLECRSAHRERYVGRMRVNRGITCDHAQRIYVCGLHDNVLIFHRNGELLHNIGPRAINTSDQLIRPFGIAVHDGYLYVADRNESCILVFTTNGQFRGALSGSTSGPGKLLGARHVSVDQVSGFIVAADAADNSVKAYRPDGSFFGKLDMVNHGIPYGLAITKDHKLVVSTSSDKIVIWSL